VVVVVVAVIVVVTALSPHFLQTFFLPSIALHEIILKLSENNKEIKKK